MLASNFCVSPAILDAIARAFSRTGDWQRDW
jgi:hypothetical protein